MTRPSVIICAVIIALEAAFVPLYLKKMWPTKNCTSLIYKMLCATGYFAIAVTAAATLGLNGYSRLMLAAFAFSWLGDLFLHIPKPKKRYFLIGMVFFMASHIFFCTSYIFVQRRIFADRPAFMLWEILLCIAIMAVYFITLYFKKVRFKAIYPAVVAYGFFVTMMMVKSSQLGIIMLAANPREYLAPAVLLLIGGVCFVQSDASLALIMFDTRFKKFKLKIYNIVTYFLAQLCLAMTLFFVY